MLTGELRSQIDAIWNAFWSGGISNPMEVMEQITYLLFIRRLDDAHTLEENKAKGFVDYVLWGDDGKASPCRCSNRCAGDSAIWSS